MVEKLFYRPLTEEDTDALVSLWGDYEVIKYTGIKNSRARKIFPALFLSLRKNIL